VWRAVWVVEAASGGRSAIAARQRAASFKTERRMRGREVIRLSSSAGRVPRRLPKVLMQAGFFLISMSPVFFVRQPAGGRRGVCVQVGVAGGGGVW